MYISKTLQIASEIITSYPILQNLNAKKGYKVIDEYIPIGSVVLDIGCGHGFLGKSLKEKKMCDVFGIDVKHSKLVEYPFILGDGSSVPICSKSIDIIILSYILHHATDPQKIIEESIRISNQLVIIFEDVPKNKFDYFCNFFHNIFSPSFSSTKRNSIEGRIFSHHEWMDLLTKYTNRIEIKVLGRFAREPWYFVNRNAYFLFI